MLIPSAFSLKSVISALLIISLIAPSLLVPPVAFASLGGGADGSGGFGEGEGPDGGGGDADGDSNGGGPGEGNSSGPGGGANSGGGFGPGASDSDGDGKSDGKEAAEAAADSKDVADAAAAMGVTGLSVEPVDTTKDANNSLEGAVSVNGQTMSKADAMAAVEAMAAANAAGMSPATGPTAPGYNVDATLSAYANDTPQANSVVGNMTGVTGTPQAVAHAEIDAAIGYSTATAASTAATAAATAASTATAPTNSLADVMATIAAHPALMDQTPIANQSYNFSPPTTSMMTAVSQPTVTPNQSFSTANQTIDATSFSLGSFAPGLSANPTAPDPNEGRMGLATGRMAQISMTLQMELDKINPLNSYLTNSVVTPTQLAQIADLESKIAALDARAVAMISPTVTNQAVASIAEAKSKEVSSIAADVKSMDDLGFTSLAQDALDAMDARADSYDSRMAAAQADAQVAQTEVDNASKVAALDVDVALGFTPSTPSMSTGPTMSAVESLGVTLGLSPTAAATVADVVDAVVSSLPGIATISAVADYADASSRASMFSAQAQAEVDEAVGLGIADSFGFSPNSQTSVSTDATDAIGLGIADSFGFGTQSTVSTAPSNAAQNAASMEAQATALGFQAIGIGLMDALGFMGFGFGVTGKAPSAASTAGKAPSTASPSTASVAATNSTTPTAPTVSYSYNPVDNTVTISPTAQVAANTVEGRFSPTASVADNASTPSVGTAASLGKAADDAAGPTGPATSMADDAAPTSPATAANDNASTPSVGTAASAGKQADDVASPTGNTTGMTGTANNLGKAADDTAAPSTPTAANDNSPTAAPSVPGVTTVDSLVGPAAPSTASAAKSMAVALSMMQALATPASIGKATVDAMQSVAAAISKSVNDFSPTSPTGIATRSADDVAQTAPAAPSQTATQSTAPAAPTASTQAPAATQVSIAHTPVAVAPTAQTPTTPSVTTAPSVTAPSQTTPAATAPAAPSTQATTPAAPTAQAPTAPTQAPTQATNPTQATAPSQTAAQAAPTQAAPAQAQPASRGPVAEAISSAVRGIGNALNEMFGITPAASEPASTVNIANLEKTSATADFVGVVPDDSRFLSFEDNTTAVRALLRDLENKIKDLDAAKTPATLNNIIPKYSPATENNPTRHANTIAAEVAKDIPGFTANTPISIENLKGPVGSALAKGFAQAEEGISLPDAEADKGVAAYVALPSVPTTLKNGVYAPTNPADQVVLDNIRNGIGVATTQATPPQATAPGPVARAADAVADVADAVIDNSPTVVAVRAGVGFLSQVLGPESPSTANPAQAQPVAQTPAQAQPVAQTVAQAAPAEGVITKDSTPAQVQQFWANRNPGKASLAKVNPTLLKAEAMGIQAFEAQNPQYKVTLQGPASGYRTGGSVANHGVQRDGYGGALDVVITDTTTNSRLTNHPLLKYKGPVSLAKAAPIYQKLFNATVIAGYHIDPAFAQSLRFGGYFASSNAMDAMHIDVRSHMPHGGGTTLGGFTPAQMKNHKMTENNPLGSWANVKSLADARYKNATGVELADVPVPMTAPRDTTTAAEPAQTPTPVSTPSTPSAPATTPDVTPPQTVEDTPVPVTAPRPDTTVTTPTTPTTPPSTVTPPPTVVIPATVVSVPASSVPSPTTPSTPSQPTSQPSSPSTVSPTTPAATTDSTSPDAPTTLGNNVGTPPDNLGTAGPGTAGTPTSANPVARAGYAAYAAIAGIIAAIANLFGGEDSETDNQTPNTPTDINAPTSPATPGAVSPVSPVAAPTTPGTDGTDVDVPSATTPGGSTGAPTSPGVTPTNPSNPDLINNNPITTASTTERETVHVLVQVDGNTGDIYFDVAGVIENGTYYDMAEDDEDDGNENGPSIILDDQRLNVVYSDGTYAPPTINGVTYESPTGPDYVYTVEFYVDGKLVSITENVDTIPKGNVVTKALDALFTDDDSYTIEDVSSVTRALIDPDSDIPADEYYVYRVYLKEGGVRGTTVPRYTSHRFMSERFAETGYSGDVLHLIGASIEVPPPSTGRVASGIVNTLKSVGLSALDLFRGNEDAGNPIVTDLGRLTPSADGEITMNDIKSVIVLLDVEAECPAIPGLTRPYLYEIVIAGSAIDNGSDQAFRAVRCGGGDKKDFVEQVAGHFETFDGVGRLDRTRLTEMIRFAAFKDLDMSRLLGDKNEDTTATSTPATVPNTTDEEEFVPNTTNEIVFEVKATGSQGQTLLDWQALNSIQIGNGVDIHFRWNGSAYQQCLPFLNDSGDYALTVSNRAMTRGDTESEGYDVREASTTYRLECGGQRNNEFGVDDRSIQVIIE